MSKHTPEPWFYHRQGFSTVYIEARIGGGMLQEIAACGPCQDGTEQQDENARRIVACVNACAGVETETLEGIAGKGLFSLAIEAVNESEDLKKQCNELNIKIDQAWGRSSYITLDGFIPGAFDAWKQPVKQFLPYDFSGNTGSSATQYCNGWNDAGGYWLNHARDLKQQRDELLAALEIASASLNDAATKMKWSDIPTAQEILRNADAIGAAIAKAKGGAA